jgi:hypothetical protein
MNRTLRGARARRGTLLPLLLLTGVVVAGVVAVIGLAEGSGTSSAVAVPLLALGLVAVPATGRQLAAIRRHEIAVARLRGVTGAQLAVTLAVEPFLVLVLGSLLGVAAGAVVAAVAAGLWVGAELSFGVTVLPAVALIVVVGLAAVLVGMAGALREPLSDQVSVAERPRPASTAALFGSLLLLVAAVVATYRSFVVDARDPGWVVLAGPALVGLALGQVTVWVVRLIAMVGVRWTAGSTLPPFLATRRLARTAEAASPIRLVVAATVIAGVSLTGAQHVTDWSDDTARLRAGAPLRVMLEGDARDALALTRELDPEGQWLMAAVSIPGEGSLPARRAFVDTERYETVVGDFLSGTPAGPLPRTVGRLTEETSALGSGDSVSATVRGVSARRSGDLRPRVTVTYINDRGRSAGVSMRLRIGLSGTATTVERGVADCSGGCAITGITLDRSAGDVERPWILTGLDLAGRSALDNVWTPEPQQLPAGVVPVEIVTVDDGLLMPVTDEPLTVTTSGSAGGLRVLATRSTTWGGEEPEIDSPGGDERPADVIDRLAALPLVEADGLLGDLPQALAGAPPTIPAAQVMVLARADTPDSVVSGLAEAAGQQPETLDQVAASLSDETGASLANVYSLMAGFCVLVALLVLASAITRQRAAHRQEVAALRVLGVGYAEARRSGRWEIGALGVGAVVATVAGGTAGVVLLLRNLALVEVPAHSVPLDVGVTVVPIAASALVAAALVVLVSGRGLSSPPEQTRPALLREEA